MEKQDTVMQNVAGMGIEMQAARQEMVEQRAKMTEIGNIADGVLGHVENLFADFKKIDAAQKRQRSVGKVLYLILM